MPKRKYSESYSIDFDQDYSDDHCSTSENSKNHPVQRNAANARERARMRVLSSAFCRLKTKLPWVPADTKLSKLDTLRLATIYIRQLRMRLATDDDSNTENSFSKFDNLPIMNNDQQCLVWPFTFQQSNMEGVNTNTMNSWPHMRSDVAYAKSMQSYSSEECKEEKKANGSVINNNNNNNDSFSSYVN